MSDDNVFLGKSIAGTISHYTDGIAEQHDPQEFIDALDALLALDSVEAVRWTQYTPYFNDGDACTFGVGQFCVKLTIDDDDADFDFGSFRGEYDLYDYPRKEDGSKDYYADRIFEINGLNTEPIYNAVNAIEGLAVHHEAILSKKFGDPAEVTYDGEQFSVEHYDHD